MDDLLYHIWHLGAIVSHSGLQSTVRRVKYTHTHTFLVRLEKKQRLSEPNNSPLQFRSVDFLPFSSFQHSLWRETKKQEKIVAVMLQRMIFK